MYLTFICLVDNRSKVADLKNMQVGNIMLHMHRMRNTSGRKMSAMKKPVITVNPSLQGVAGCGHKVDSASFRITQC